MIRRLLMSLPLSLLFLGLVGTAAHAGGEPEPPDKCFQQMGPNGELPICEYDGTEWTVSYEDAPFGPGGDMGMPGGDMGIPAGFFVFGVIVVLVGIAGTIWRVSLARQMARESGLDPDRATAMTLMSDDGLDATYLASSMRTVSGGDTSPAPEPRLAQERLRELQQLRDDGLISTEEYERRRTAIIDSI